MVPVTDDPAFPRILLIGDSISISYTLPVRDLLKGKANVHRILTNGGPATNGVANIDKWLGTGKWDLIHLNFGLHDLKVLEAGEHQVTIQDHESNLKKMTVRLKQTQAELIWAATRPLRCTEDVRDYNAVAEKVMKDVNIPINDLYTFAPHGLGNPNAEQRPSYTRQLKGPRRAGRQKHRAGHALSPGSIQSATISAGLTARDDLESLAFHGAFVSILPPGLGLVIRPIPGHLVPRRV